ncbi:MAG: bifunctional 5,10-methylenetetrahydrofolate dehydrogenase/5,10-methenyltetrahydrofolate cyclohydrolase [Phycisphaerae bacterium]|jgi:methylenetetrahydrofolate dehydrogenase (NADP+)/methenyltetrahydrofolate cyclohydrolase|nr:bifunctional 5,10-methylenetetrahydrofolate dehydrogenase/5,10-methenyltetrahydrofolate cyclohydrolase [Phycisphaerae bacterium]
MAAKIIDGEKLAEEIKASLKPEIADLKAKGWPARLASILVGENRGAIIYTNRQKASCEEIGIEYELVKLPETTTQDELAAKIADLNSDKSVAGIILQMPLPEDINARQMSDLIAPQKDVEGTSSANLGQLFFYEPPDLIPCTAAAAFELARATIGELKGVEAVVVGHSPIVGKPVACLLTNALATTQICHIGTRDLRSHTVEAELLIIAAGKAGLITEEIVKPGAVVIDVGINRVKVLDEAGEPVLNDKGRPKMKTVGDVDYESVKEVAGAITPVPGGVGPVTVAMLLRNTVRAAKAQAAV